MSAWNASAKNLRSTRTSEFIQVSRRFQLDWQIVSRVTRIFLAVLNIFFSFQLISSRACLPSPHNPSTKTIATESNSFLICAFLLSFPTLRQSAVQMFSLNLYEDVHSKRRPSISYTSPFERRLVDFLCTPCFCLLPLAKLALLKSFVFLR